MFCEIRDVTDLTIADLQKFPIWEYILDELAQSDTTVKPVKGVPVDDLSNRIVGTQVKLNNNQYVWATLSNISLRNQKSTKHFLLLSITKNNQWFHLSRYHDSDYMKHGPNELASFLDLKINEIFPIQYDISKIAIGDPNVVSGLIYTDEKDKLTKEELISLSLEE